MKVINLLPEPSPEQEQRQQNESLQFLLELENLCPGCMGKGLYVGFRSVEDPCGYCGGSGRAPEQS
jgi:DnaJ-class molecular chaperone